MLLQSTTAKPPLPSSHLQTLAGISATVNSLSFRQTSVLSLKPSIIFISPNGNPKNSTFISCSSMSQVHSYGTVDFEKRPKPNWNEIYKKISFTKNSDLGSVYVLDQVESEGKKLSKWELCRIVKELRKFKRRRYALQVYEWMNNRSEFYTMTSSDAAIQLDLIAKVYGISSAEQYFIKLPNELKDNRAYGALLNAYVRARMQKEAEFQMDKMRNKGYARHALPFNVMMTLYMDLEDHEKIESLVKEMTEKKIQLDIYTYNILMASHGSQGSLDIMEQVFYQMQQNRNINPNWTTFSTMATMYIRFRQFEKAEDCLEKIESKITGRDRLPYHYLISLYGSAGNKDKVYRTWNVYKSTFTSIPNLGYHTFISSLVRLDDIEGAEKIYNDWLTVKSSYDPRVGNLLLSSYVKKRLSEKAHYFFNQIIQVGGKPNSMTWEILAEDHIHNRRIPEALSCFQNAISAEGSRKWRPRSQNVTSILMISEQEADSVSKDTLLEVLKQVGVDDVKYKSNGSPELDTNYGSYSVMTQIEESF